MATGRVVWFLLLMRVTATGPLRLRCNVPEIFRPTFTGRIERKGYSALSMGATAPCDDTAALV
jgi:hypothetical protein